MRSFIKNSLAGLGASLYLLAAVALLVIPIPAQAAVTATPVFAQTPKTSVVNFVQGTDAAGTYKTIYTGGTNGSKIVGMWASTNDGSASHLINVQFSTSTSAHCSPQSNCAPLGAVTLPVNSGFANAAAAVNLMSNAVMPQLPHDSDGNNFFFMTGSTQTIEATFATALTASTQISITIVTADY